MLLKFLIVYSMFFIFLISTRYIKVNKRYYTFAKTVNSIGFIMVAAYGGIVLGNMSDFYFMLPALALCLCGDVFLGIYTQYDLNKFFACGLFSFLTAHIAFAIAFSKIAPLRFYDFIIPIISVFITIQLSKLENMNIDKKMKKYVFLYSFFVSLLLSKGIGIILTAGLSVKCILIFIGSLMFFISDFIIFFLYFYKKKHHLVGTFNLMFYYYGMFLLALSLWY